MESKRTYGGLDVYRFLAALLVVAIHTSPLASFHSGADFFLTRILARLAVPFFFMVTGQFLLSDYLFGRTKDFAPLGRYLRKTVLLYGLAAALYLPVGLYAGQYENLTLPALLRMVFFDGTFYHLWYFPALLTGILLLCLLGRLCSPQGCAVAVIALYGAGLLGDSYWGLISRIPGLAAVYEAGFHIYSYTRNGIFLAPLFLFLGAWFGQKKIPLGRGVCLAGFILSFYLMTAEAFTLRYFSIQRHDSMYVMLPVCAFFLYCLLLHWRVRPCRKLRSLSAWIYILHPGMILVVRGAAKLLRLEGLLIQNSLVHYTAVCVLSVSVSLLLASLPEKGARKPFARGRAWIELDREALRHNAALLSSLLPDTCELMPALKANAYGHGAVPVAKELNRLGVRAFCVACADEGVELRKNGIRGTILILGYTHPSQFHLLRRYRLTQAVVDYSYARELNRYGKKLRVHVAIDTGMRRLGEPSDRLDHLCEIFEMDNLVIDGAFTHLCADDTDNPRDQEFTRRQANDFYRTIEKLRKRGFSCPKIHLLSSYGVLNYPEFSGDYARVGIALYGVRSARADYQRADLPLRPVLSLKARIAVVKELLPGESAGYGLTFTAPRSMRIATLTIGYADGLPRSLSGGVGSVLINGRRAPVIGRICMDQTTVDVTDIPEVRPGGMAVVIGASGEESISPYDLAEQSGTITNEILSRMGARITYRLFSSAHSPSEPPWPGEPGESAQSY